jgi:hypothetical protein
MTTRTPTDLSDVAVVFWTTNLADRVGLCELATGNDFVFVDTRIRRSASRDGGFTIL